MNQFSTVNKVVKGFIKSDSMKIEIYLKKIAGLKGFRSTFLL